MGEGMGNALLLVVLLPALGALLNGVRAFASPHTPKNKTITNAIALVVQLFLATFVLNRFPLKVALLITPVVIMASSGAFGVGSGARGVVAAIKDRRRSTSVESSVGSGVHFANFTRSPLSRKARAV